MNFQSADYLIFLAVLLAVYWTQRRRGQNLLLLLGSYFFYGYVHPWFLILLFSSTLVDYSCGIGLARPTANRRALLAVSLGVNLGLLGTFKYFGFFVDSMAVALDSLGIPAQPLTLEIFLPVGISFYTFQTLGYTLDVYRGRLEARRDFLDYALFVGFFPQLVAGPIERAGHLLPQVEQQRRFSPHQASDGVLLILWGFFKKLVIADAVAVVANKIFALSQPDFALLWIGVLAFGVQIYADFSAYTDIARGTAKLFGFELMRNFDHPYLSQSPGEFWRRWHISLSSWFRDYVYIPLGGRRAAAWRRARNVMITFVLSGLWHGASWNFALWGTYHGALLLLYRGVERLWPSLLTTRWLIVPRVVLFFALTNLGWLFFREHDLGQIGRDLLLSPAASTTQEWGAAAYFLGLVSLYALPLALHAAIDGLELPKRLRGRGLGILLEAGLACLLLLGIVMLHSTESSDFIYFRF